MLSNSKTIKKEKMSDFFNSFSRAAPSTGGFAFGSSSGAFGFGTNPSSSNNGSTSAAAGHFGSSPFGSSSASSGPSLFSGSVPSTTTTRSAPTAQTSQSTRTNSTGPTSANKPHANVKKDTEVELIKRISFLSGFVSAFKEQTHTDILLKPNNGPCIPAHKALLAARSEIFKTMLDSDGCKAPPSDADTVTLSDLNTEGLESLLEFLYTGNLSLEKLEKHVYSLYIAADKYDIPYLQESCERYMLNSLNTSNAINILEISDAHLNKTLKETAMYFIVGNMKDIVSTKKYENFASSNPNLCLQITRAFVDAKST